MVHYCSNRHHDLSSMLYFKKKYLNSLTPYIENYNIFMNIVDENAIHQ